MFKKLIIFSFSLFFLKNYPQTIIKMIKTGGVYEVPCKINGLPLYFIFDTGASDVSISLTEAAFMIKNNYLKLEDLGEEVYYSIANGDVAKGTKLNLREVEFGGLKFYNISASIVHELSAPLLLGQSVIEKLGKIQIYNSQLTIFNENINSYDFNHKHSAKYKKEDLFAEAELNFKNMEYKMCLDNFLKIYNLSKNDTVALYNAALCALNGKLYNEALIHLEHLNKLNYSGITTLYYAKNKQTKKIDKFNDKNSRNICIKNGTHKNPRDGKSESKKGEIIRFIALIHNLNGDTEKAKDAFKEARKANPTDKDLFLSELKLYRDSKDQENYDKLANEAIQAIPDNEDLLFTLGINYSEFGQVEKAKKYLGQLIAKNPDYKYANYYMGIAVLGDEKPIIDQMNSLGNSAADNKKYDELKEKREGILKASIPYFKAELSNSDEKADILAQLKSIYVILNMDDEAKKVQAEIDAIDK